MEHQPIAALDASFTRQLNQWMTLNGLVPVDAREYAKWQKAKQLFSDNGNISRKGEIVETPWGMIEV